MKKQMKKLNLAKETVRNLEGGQVVGGTFYLQNIGQSDTSYTGCDVCVATSRTKSC